MSVLIICEKPSVAKTVALALGAAEQKDGYLSGDGLLVSWCIGHLISMADAGSYDERYKKWRYEDLPILPQTWKYAPTPGKLLFLAGSRGIFPRLRQNGKILIAPLFVSLVIAARVCHADKMPDAP